MSSPSPSQRPTRVGIVGAGPGGLMTAYMLERAAHEPIDVTLLEASSRVGGKIVTDRFESRPVAFEAGAAELYDNSPIEEDPLKELCLELGLPLAPMGGNSVFLDERLIANLDDLEQHLGRDARAAVEEFERRALDRMGPHEFYEADSPLAYSDANAGEGFDRLIDAIGNADAERYVRTLIHSDLATEPRLTNVRYGLQNVLMNHPRYMQLYYVAGGNEQLATALAERIAGPVRFGTRVERVARGADGAMVVGARDATGTEHTLEFDRLVVALPLDALAHVRFEGSLGAAIQRHTEHHDHPAHYLRMTLLFETASWRREHTDSFWMVDAFEGACLYDESSRMPDTECGVLGWLLGGDAAERYSRLDDDELVRRALDALPASMHGARDEFLEGRVHRWVAAVNAMPGGREPIEPDLRHRPDPVDHPDLFVVGDYLFDSTLNGVCDSARYVADWIAALDADRIR